ncbi:MAG: hypothetical protein KBC96_14395 [Armatimonadetes bacterium]|nr:hypothetical protein [Armatimonadota bacterium]
MTLALKPDFDEARRYWDAFWAGAIIDRPTICLKVAPPPGSPPHPGSLSSIETPAAHVRAFGEWASSVQWLAEAVPFYFPNHGPDMFAAWVGGDLRYSPDSAGTTWSVPNVRDWATDALEIGAPHGGWWERMLDLMRVGAEIAEGRFLMGMSDIHSNMDALSALRGPQELCTDLFDVPDRIDAAMQTVRKAFPRVIDGLRQAGRMDGRGYIGWLPFYSETTYAVLQCDFACMIGPEHFRRWVLPSLEEESSYLQHSVYHYDGPDALVHLHDVLSIPGIRAIQWVSGAGNAPTIEWMDLLVEIQKAGKAVYIGASADEIPSYCKRLRPEHVLYDVTVRTEQEARSLLAWMKRNT